MSAFAMATWQKSPTKQWIFGVVATGREDIPVLPMAGLVLTPNDYTRIELTVPRPRYARYPTGVSYLQSAQDLRTQLRETVERIDPEGRDAALSQMVLVGRSMGGLVAKLQVTHSDELLWNAVSDRPFDELQSKEETRQAIEDALFFEPLPFVARVVFIATPHGGSQWTRRPVARLGWRMIEFPPKIRQNYQQLVHENEGLFNEQTGPDLPISIDQLDPMVILCVSWAGQQLLKRTPPSLPRRLY